MLFSLCCWGAAPETVSAAKEKRHSTLLPPPPPPPPRPPTITQTPPSFCLSFPPLFFPPSCLIFLVKLFHSAEIAHGEDLEDKGMGHFHTAREDRPPCPLLSGGGGPRAGSRGVCGHAPAERPGCRALSGNRKGVAIIDSPLVIKR